LTGSEVIIRLPVGLGVTNANEGEKRHKIDFNQPGRRQQMFCNY